MVAQMKGLTIFNLVVCFINVLNALCVELGDIGADKEISNSN